MYQYNTIGKLTRIVIGGLWVEMIVKSVAYVGLFYPFVFVGGDVGQTSGLAALAILLALLSILIFVVVGILFLRWTYRAAVNAHAGAGTLPISPGWAVGWYFVPLANLWKPFQAMKQIWRASRYGSDWAAHRAPGLLGWWWGLSILVLFLDDGVWRMLDRAPTLAGVVGLADGLLTIPLSLLLMRIMRQVAEAQDATRHAGIFA